MSVGLCTNFVLQSDAFFNLLRTMLYRGRWSRMPLEDFSGKCFQDPENYTVTLLVFMRPVVVYSEKEFRAFSDLAGARRMNHSKFGFQIVATI